MRAAPAERARRVERGLDVPSRTLSQPQFARPDSRSIGSPQLVPLLFTSTSSGSLEVLREGLAASRDARSATAISISPPVLLADARRRLLQRLLVARHAIVTRARRSPRSPRPPWRRYRAAAGHEHAAAGDGEESSCAGEPCYPMSRGLPMQILTRFSCCPVCYPCFKRARTG